MQLLVSLWAKYPKFGTIPEPLKLAVMQEIVGHLESYGFEGVGYVVSERKEEEKTG